MKMILIYKCEECDMPLNLSDLRMGDKAKVRGFYPCNPHYLQQLLAMGLVPDTEFTVIRVAPLGDPVEIKLNTISLCVRKREGAVLQLERVECIPCSSR
jgi:Fe2+ transport system protein FeoA